MLDGHAQHSINLLVLQPSSFCNINCRYCYVRGRDRSKRMSEDVLAAVARNIVPSSFSPPQLSICWHSGEPLAVPKSWYDRACGILETSTRPDQRLIQNIQTNAMLIDPAWVDCFRRHGFRVGVSIDGPREIHDANRVTRRGLGTFDRAMAGVAHLRQAHYDYDVIAVLTDRALSEPDAMFDFFNSLGMRSLGFNIDEIEGPNRTSTLGGPGAELRFQRFLDRFFNRHAQAGEPFILRPLAQLRSAIAGKHRTPCRTVNDQVEPLRILVVGVDGSLSTFSPELIGTPDARFADFTFGNVRNGGPEIVLGNRAFRRLNRLIEAGRRRCARTCGYYDLCLGGAPGNKYFESGRFDIDETLYCRLSVKTTIETSLKHLESIGTSFGG